MISSTMGKSPRTGRRLLPPMYSRKATDQTQKTTCTVQSYCYLHGRVILMTGQIQQMCYPDDWSNTATTTLDETSNLKNIEVMYYKLIFSFRKVFSINQYTTMPYIKGRLDPAELTQADLTRGRLDPDSSCLVGELS